MRDINATVIVDLDRPEEEILNNLEKDAKRGLIKAKREGLKVIESKDFESIYEIYKNTMAEGGAEISSLETLKNNTKVLLICIKDSKPIATLGVKLKDNIPVLYFNASIKEAQQFQPNNLLYWEGILWAKDNGFTKFDLGGYQIKARGHLIGINKFKENWGEIVYFYLDYPFLKAIGRKLIRNFRFFYWLNKKIKGRK